MPQIDGASDAHADDHAAIRRLDRDAFGGDRSALCDWLFENARVAVLRNGLRVDGFAACREFGRGHVIGPLVAPDVSAAMALVFRLAAPLTGQFLRLDVVEGDAFAQELTKFGLQPGARSPLMQRGETSIAPHYRTLFSQGFC